MRAGSIFGFSALLIPATTVVVAILTRGAWWPLAGSIGAALVAFGLGWAYGSAHFRHYRIQHMADGLLVQSGVFWQSETFVPRSRIQHTEVNQGPLDRRWGMAKLIVHTAGTRLENIKVTGMHHPDALALRDALLDRREGVDGA